MSNQAASAIIVGLEHPEVLIDVLSEIGPDINILSLNLICGLSWKIFAWMGVSIFLGVHVNMRTLAVHRNVSVLNLRGAVEWFLQLHRLHLEWSLLSRDGDVGLHFSVGNLVFFVLVALVASQMDRVGFTHGSSVSVILVRLGSLREHATIVVWADDTLCVLQSSLSWTDWTCSLILVLERSCAAWRLKSGSALLLSHVSCRILLGCTLRLASIDLNVAASVEVLLSAERIGMGHA